MLVARQENISKFWENGHQAGNDFSFFSLANSTLKKFDVTQKVVESTQIQSPHVQGIK